MNIIYMSKPELPDLPTLVFQRLPSLCGLSSVVVVVVVVVGE